MAEYIEREALFKFADAIEQDFLARNERPVFDLEGLRYLAQQLPSADVAPVVHGRWETIGVYARCTNCGTAFEAKPTRYFFEMNNKFCRMCGARMDGE